jgi:ArsR family transcriptional regulator
MGKPERKQAAEQKEAKEALERMAGVFKALGDPTRLRIFEYLRASCGPIAVSKSGDVRPVDGLRGPEGVTVGDVVYHVTGGAKDPSTVSHHLKELRQAGLITMERHGKHMICSTNREAVAALTTYLMESRKEESATPVMARPRKPKPAKVASEIAVRPPGAGESDDAGPSPEA